MARVALPGDYPDRQSQNITKKKKKSNLKVYITDTAPSLKIHFKIMLLF